jgi:hypothetical protein
MNCVVEGCSAPRAKGRQNMCGLHYQRNRKYGDPLAGQTNKGALERFLSEHVAHSGDECLPWPFGTKGNGYGHIRFHGVSMTANKAMCILAHGAAPSPQHEAAHSCGNGHLGCVNPRHLRWATRLENVHDAMRDGTSSRGERHSQSIKAAFAAFPRSARRAAKRLGIDVETLTKEASAAA